MSRLTSKVDDKMSLVEEHSTKSDTPHGHRQKRSMRETWRVPRATLTISRLAVVGVPRWSNALPVDSGNWVHARSPNDLSEILVERGTQGHVTHAGQMNFWTRHS